MIPKWVTSVARIMVGAGILDKPGLEARLNSLDHWAAFFTLLVVIGVGGELVVHLLSSRASGRLIAFQNAEEQTLQAEVVRLGSVTAEANRAVAQANERANQMELQTEELRKENLEIQRKINPRFLTASEQKSIIDAITPFRGHQIIITKLGDGEAGPYGDSIIAAFQKAGWRVQVNYVGITSPTYGVVFRISAHPDIAIKAAFAAFQNVGVKTSIQEIPTQDDSWIDMLVGLKPVA